MNYKKLLAGVLIAAGSVVVVVGSMAIAESSQDVKAAGKPELKPPPGWTEAEMQACTLAGTPGKMHERLAKDVGVWHGKTSMRMVPDGEPVTGESTGTVTLLMDGRFTKCETAGETPGMGPCRGLGIYGFDNVSKKFVSIWIDNHSTGIMQGEGELSPDGKTITWKYTCNCPVTGKPTVLREVEQITGPDTKTLEMFATDHKSGKEFKMMRIELTRKPDVRAQR